MERRANTKVVPLVYYVSVGLAVSGEGVVPTKGDVQGEHRVKTIIENYFGRTVVVFEPLPK